VSTQAPTVTAREVSAPAALAAGLNARLPSTGRVLLLDDGRLAGLEPARDEVERRSARDGVAPESLDPGPWRAVVLSCPPPAAGWHPLLAAIHRRLEPRGRLFLLLPSGAGAGLGTAAPEAIGSLYESAFCLLREEELGEGLLLEARADDHLVRSYRDGDEEAILRLFAASFSPPRDLGHWRWKYRDNPFGALAISCAFTADQELVAHYAAYPVRFRRARRDGGETLLCHQVGDTMTDRRHRDVGRGPTSLLGRTARHFYARRCEGRVAFNYGFNTGNIQRFSQLFVGARKVRDVELSRCGARDLRLEPPRRFRPYRTSRVDRLDAAFDRLFEQVAPDYGLLIERRRSYLDWRYLRCPDRDYHLIRVDRGAHLVGWGVFRREGDRLLWGDALIDPGHRGATSALLRHACGIAATRPAAARGGAVSQAAPVLGVEGWFSRHPQWWSELLGELGFTAAPEPQALGMVYVPFLEDPGAELESAYYLAMGDGDLF
jgi:hypothetical protein